MHKTQPSCTTHSLHELYTAPMRYTRHMSCGTHSPIDLHSPSHAPHILPSSCTTLYYSHTHLRRVSRLTKSCSSFVLPVFPTPPGSRDTVEPCLRGVSKRMGSNPVHGPSVG
ncbi:hypothetical protein E2C01_084467 [Portunus trituberculatus]|uniref:Uncharacterized protein n=2 Tax=Portunus trituberculatus TaxID=210409 RepID=A0A5B7J6D4_PORTR|nr:hypothetical protein [Portunus trituberculatus]